MTITDYIAQKDKFRLLGSGAEGEARLVDKNLVAKHYGTSDYMDRKTTLDRIMTTRKYIDSLCNKLPFLGKFVSQPDLVGYVLENNQLLIFTEYITENECISGCKKCDKLHKLANKLNHPKWGLSDVSGSIGNYKIKDHKIYLIDVHSDTEYEI